MAGQIFTNIPSLRSQNAYSKNSFQASIFMEQLNTGSKLNKASDGPSEYAIDANMTAQVRGLDQGTINAQTGIDLLNVAQGSQNTILQIMNEIRVQIVKASNDTNTQADRQKIATQVDNLVSQVDQIATTTQYNQNYLITGNWSQNGLYIHSGANAGEGSSLNLGDLRSQALGITNISQVISSNNGNAANGKIRTGSNIFFTSAGITASITLASTTSVASSAGTYRIDNDTSFILNTDGTVQLFGFRGVTDGTIFNGNSYSSLKTTFQDNNSTATLTFSAIASGSPAKITYNAGKLYTAGLTAPPNVGQTSTFSMLGDNVLVATGVANATGGTVNLKNSNYTFSGSSDIYALDALGNGVNIEKGKTYTTDELKQLYGLSTTAAGTQARFTVNGNQFTLDFDTSAITGANNTKAVFIGGVEKSGQVISQQLNVVDNAIAIVTNEAANTGARVNGLQYIIDNNTNSSTNLSASKSTYHDTDYTKASAEYSKYNTLQQAAQAMLAQVNAQPQQVLALIPRF